MVAIAFTRYKYSKATNVYDILKFLTIAHTWFDPKDIWGLCVADGAVQKVAVIASVEARV